MISQQKILLTGITGAVGSWIAAEALKRKFRISALMRDEKVGDARERVRQVLDIAGTGDHLDSVNIIEGDICEELSGVADNTKVADASMIFHCAASTDFRDSASEQSFRANVGGTRNVLDLAAKLRVPICYISTAYIAGKRQGIVKESETDIGQEFNNVYERTKCEAEVLVHKWTIETGLPAFIFRPGIVIGDSERGRIATFNGIYNILRFFDAVVPIIGDEEVRVVGKANATKNLIAVDYLAKAIWYIIERGGPGTYHITNPMPLTLGQLREIYAELFGLNGKLVDKEDFRHKKPSRTEVLYQKKGSLYTPYMAAEPVFDRTNTDAVLKHTDLKTPVIDSAYFARLVEYAKSVQWGKSQPKQYNLPDRSIAAFERYFDDFLAKKMHKQLLPDLHKLSATFRIVLKERADVYRSLAIKQGVLSTVSRNDMDCECTFVVDAETFGQIASGRTSPQQAFFKRQLDIAGNIETGLKLATVLAAFFKKYPCNWETFSK
jgi:nucleoside-diphosphate-sugar epimerase/putative sterol carrier protein